MRTGLVSLAAALALAVGCAQPAPASIGPTTPLAATGALATGAMPVARAARPASALVIAARLPVKGRAPMTGYSRAAFGPAWRDTDRNGCDQRNDTLRRDLRRLVLKAGTRGCVVRAGTLTDPYTGRVLSWAVGASITSAVDVDHVVALADAWVKGAARWPAPQRVAFANDTLNLLAVSASANRAKRAGDAATWLPPARRFRCAYVARQVAVKAKYRLTVTAAERRAMQAILATCPTLPLPTAKVAPLGGGPTGAPSPARLVRPGAFCAPVGAVGRSANGLVMRCTTRLGDRARWRAA